MAVRLGLRGRSQGLRAGGSGCGYNRPTGEILVVRELFCILAVVVDT